MWLIDHSTMIMIILAGFGVGIKGVFGFDVTDYLGVWQNFLFVAVGFAAIWQLGRQRFPLPAPRQNVQPSAGDLWGQLF